MAFLNIQPTSNRVIGLALTYRAVWGTSILLGTNRLILSRWMYVVGYNSFLAFHRVIQTRFLQASELAGQEFLSRLSYYSSAWLPARGILTSSVISSKAAVDPTARIILLEQFLPWKVLLPFW